MIPNPLNFISKRFRVGFWVVGGLSALYLCFSLVLFFFWIEPTLSGYSDQRIAADSTTYIQIAEALRDGTADPLMLASLYSFPNTLWSPVLLAFVLRSTFLMVLANYAMFLLAITLLRKTYFFSLGRFLALLLLNPTTTVSLLSVNKEIIDLAMISIFLFGYTRNRKSLILLALILALFNRFEVCVVMFVFLIAQSRLNPLRRRRGWTLAALVVGLSVMLPLFAAESLTRRFEEASSGGIIVWLDSLEMHYLYGVAVIPKVVQNLFGEIPNILNWGSPDSLTDIANSYIIVLNNLVTAFVIATLVIRRNLSLRSDPIYFAMLGSVIMAVSLVVQPRYFYFVFALLCLQAASGASSRKPMSPRLAPQEIANA